MDTQHVTGQLPPVWVISLERSKARRKAITQHLSDIGLPFQFRAAVDGRTMSHQALQDVYDARGAKSVIGRELHPEEVACALSHLRCYQDMIDEDLNEVLILEDDAALEPNFREIIFSLQASPLDWELALLFHHGAVKLFWKQTAITANNRLVRFVSPAMGSVAYLVRRGAAKKILDAAFPIQMPIDHMTGGDLGTGVKLYGVEPPVVRHVLNRARDAEDLRWEDTTIPSPLPLWPQQEKQDSTVRAFLKRGKSKLINFYIRFRPKYIK